MKCPTCQEDISSKIVESGMSTTLTRVRMLENIQTQRIKVWKCEKERIAEAVVLLGLHSEMDKWEIALLEAAKKNPQEESA